MIRWHLTLLSLALMAAGPSGSFTTTAPVPEFKVTPRRAPKSTTPPGYEAAPTPNQDAGAPKTQASKDSSLSPSFFYRKDQYQGEGLPPSSSVQTEQDRKARPGAGISLSMPLQ